MSYKIISKDPTPLGWFHQMILDWTGCPAMEGDFETGCHTPEGNEVVLYMENTKQYRGRQLQLYNRMFSHFRKKGSSMSGRLFEHELLPNHLCYNVLSAGPAVPTYLARYSWNWCWNMVELIVQELRDLNRDEPLDFNERHFRDVHNYILRQFNVWLNENKHACKLIGFPQTEQL